MRLNKVKQERIEKTRATAVGLLEALDDADMVKQAVEIIKEMSQQRMLAEHQEIIHPVLEKSRNGALSSSVPPQLAFVRRAPDWVLRGCSGA
ncbi:hypothetical protein [Halosimplex amylolyticum]|uniref:hypothetical protein n=1 Tax=Halosimplex amylolyticum TaxID=3396616 RepID=UPI003F56BDE2